jgi:hypothetical protein
VCIPIGAAFASRSPKGNNKPASAFTRRRSAAPHLKRIWCHPRRSVRRKQRLVRFAHPAEPHGSRLSHPRRGPSSGPSHRLRKQQRLLG